MLYYSVFNCYPYQGLDSILIFEFDKVLCSYRFECEDGAASVEFINFLYKIEQTKMYQLSRPDAEDLILKRDAESAYQDTKRLVKKILEASQKEELQLAYRAARNYYFETVRALESPEACGLELNVRQNKKEGADAIFKVVRRVYEQEYMLDECLPRGFDGLPEETIDAMYNQECERRKKDEIV